jgi:hypothetical protein
MLAEDSAAVHDAALVEAIIPLAPGLTERLTEPSPPAAMIGR